MNELFYFCRIQMSQQRLAAIIRWATWQTHIKMNNVNGFYMHWELILKITSARVLSQNEWNRRVRNRRHCIFMRTSVSEQSMLTRLWCAPSHLGKYIYIFQYKTTRHVLTVINFFSNNKIKNNNPPRCCLCTLMLRKLKKWLHLLSKQHFAVEHRKRHIWSVHKSGGLFNFQYFSLFR